MNACHDILLNLLGRALWASPYSPSGPPVDWQALFTEANQQAVSCLIYDCLTDQERASLPGELAQRWKMHSYRGVMRHETLMTEQRRLVELLEQNSIPCVILKGYSCAMYYPNPSLRSMGDIDILVAPEQQNAAYQLLHAQGYERQDECHNVHYELFNAATSITVELHKEPNGVYRAGKMQDQLYAFFADALACRHFYDGVPVMADKHQAMVLLLHKLGHFLHRGLGIRQFCDWAVFVRAKPAALWDDLRPLLKRTGLWQFTQVVTRTCIEGHLLPAECAPWAMEMDGQLAIDLLEQLLADGDFGCKADNYGQIFFTDYSASSRLTSMIRVSVDLCNTYWPVCKKHRILMPIAPFVVYFKYLKRRLAGERPKFEATRQFKDAGTRRRLFHSLRPFMEDADDGN